MPMPQRFVKYNPRLVLLARSLRNNSTLSEVILWQQLKGKKVLGFDFHRQKPIDEYIVDFFCPRLMLAIEIDGSSHSGKSGEDRTRQEKLESLGVRFLRFQDNAVKQDLHGVISIIRDWILEHQRVALTIPSRAKARVWREGSRGV